MLSMTLSGDKALERKLRKLPNTVAKKVVRSAVRKGAKPILAAAKANAAGMVGGQMGSLLRRFLTIRAFRRQRRGSYGVRVDVNEKGDEYFIDVSKSGKRNWIPAAIEYGHDNAPAIPFMRSAMDRTKEQAIEVTKRELRNGIEQAGKRP